MVARATRVDPHAGPREKQLALVFHPNDPLFAQFRRRMETEQGMLAKRPKERRAQSTLPIWLLEQLGPKVGIEPVSSNALALRYEALRPGADLALRRPELEELQSELLEPPSVVERRLRARLDEINAVQAVEDEGGRKATRASSGPGLYHRCSAALKQVTGNKSRAQMTLAELETAVGRLERNRLAEPLHSLNDDAWYAWTGRKRGEWKPPVGRDKGGRSNLSG